MKVPKRLWLLILLLLPFLFLTLLFFTNKTGPKPKYLADLRLVLPRLPYDHALNQMEAMAAPTMNKNFLNKELESLTEAEIDQMLTTYKGILEAYRAWDAGTSSPGLAWSSEIGNHSRRLDQIHMDFQSKMPRTRKINRLIHLFAIKAKRSYGSGEVAEGNYWMKASLGVNGLLFQNPTLVEYMSGVSMNFELSKVLLSAVPTEAIDEDLLALLPTKERLEDGIVKAMYLQAMLGESSLRNDELFPKGILGALVKLTYNQAKTIEMNRQIFLSQKAYLQQPLYQFPEDILADLGFRETNIMKNLSGTAVIASNHVSYQRFVLRSGWARAFVDSTRLQLIARQRGLPLDLATTTALIAELNLLNPFTDKPYKVGPNGKIIWDEAGTIKDPYFIRINHQSFFDEAPAPKP